MKSKERKRHGNKLISMHVPQYQRTYGPAVLCVKEHRKPHTNVTNNIFTEQIYARTSRYYLYGYGIISSRVVRMVQTKETSPHNTIYNNKGLFNNKVRIVATTTGHIRTCVFESHTLQTYKWLSVLRLKNACCTMQLFMV